MRLNINLATQPYQDIRRFLFRWGFGVAVAAIVTLALLWAAISATVSWHRTTAQANHYRDEIAKCDREIANAKALLDRSDNRTTRDQSLFINTLIARKAFSWTEVLTDLERILPPGIHIVSIAPDINDDGQLELHVAAAGPSRERAIELISKMENSPRFSNAMLRNDQTDQGGEAVRQGAVNYRFDITALYVPSGQRPAPPESKTVAQNGKEVSDGRR
jgi:type IV pilus assembly protein PilN